MSIYLKQLQLGPMQNYVYLVGDSETKEAAVVDPAWNVPAILSALQEDGYKLTHVLLSHGHYDHINGVEEIVEKTDATVCAEKSELEEFIYEGMGGMVIPRSSLKKTSVAESVRVGTLDIQMIHTPGHTPGSRCMLMRPKAGGQAEALMTGDTLFVGTIGRCDFPYSSPNALYQSLAKLKKLDDAVTLYPGHDYGASSSNQLGREKKTNPFLMARELEQFLQLVRR
jgi:glyoxylase-like metal-dependent hydrolase (beta-lactamase superfamily II)